MNRRDFIAAMGLSCMAIVAVRRGDILSQWLDEELPIQVEIDLVNTTDKRSVNVKLTTEYGTLVFPADKLNLNITSDFSDLFKDGA